MNYNFITINDDIYPECLKEISNPPLKLYYKGKLDLKGLTPASYSLKIRPFSSISLYKLKLEAG